MDELIGRLATKAGTDDAVSKKTIGIILDFLRSEGPSDKAPAFIDGIGGAETAIAESRDCAGLASLMGGGLLAAATKLMALGLDINKIQIAVREIMEFGRDEVGAEMSEIIARTPGVRQFA